MSDLLLQQDEYGNFDLVIEDNDIKLDDGLETATISCLFLDSGDAQNKDRSWYGEQILDHKVGGKLYKYATGKYYQGVTADIQNETKNALQPLLDYGIVSAIKVTTVRDSETNNITNDVTLYKGLVTKQIRYSLNWDKQLWRGEE